MNKGFVSSVMAEPAIFGWSFIALIPVFSLIYCAIGFEGFSGDPSGFVDFTYFSAVTVTTLGYGDIYPKSEFARFIVSLEVLLGVVCAGLFLNACSYRLSARTAAEEKAVHGLALRRERYEANKEVLRSHHAIVSFRLERYVVRLWQLTNPPDRRGDFSLDRTIGLGGKVAHDFQLRDMRFLHQETLLARDAFRASIVSYYFKDLSLLVGDVRDLLRFCKLGDWAKLHKDCLEFLHAFEHLDYSESIMKFEQMGREDKGLEAQIFSMIESAPDEPPKVKGSHMLDSYVCLYYLAKKSVAFCREYIETVDDVLASACPEGTDVSV